MGDFEILVGPNASGKTTFLDVPAFLGQLVRDGIDEAVEARGIDLRDLTWGASGDRLELAVELEIPPELRQEPARTPMLGRLTGSGTRSLFDGTRRLPEP